MNLPPVARQPLPMRSNVPPLSFTPSPEGHNGKRVSVCVCVREKDVRFSVLVIVSLLARGRHFEGLACVCISFMYLQSVLR